MPKVAPGRSYKGITTSREERLLRLVAELVEASVWVPEGLTKREIAICLGFRGDDLTMCSVVDYDLKHLMKLGIVLCIKPEKESRYKTYTYIYQKGN